MNSEDLKSLLSYDHKTGIFRWIKSPCRNVKIGSIAGCKYGNGYIYITIKGKKHRAHRLAFLYIYGYTPKNIDHINGVKDDNMISNLRQANNSSNGANMKLTSRNKSGYKGVHWHKSAGKWYAQLNIDGKTKYLGSFDCPKEAYALYCEKAKALHGEFFNAG